MDRSKFISCFRPHRLPRETYQGMGTVFFSFNIARRQPVLKATVAQQCMAALERVLPQYHARGDAFCFMPDHAHVLATGMLECSDVWQAIVELKWQTGRWFYERRLGFSWQRGFDARILQPDSSVDAVCEYILNNPVRLGLVEDWRVYPYSGRIEWESCTLRL